MLLIVQGLQLMIPYANPATRKAKVSQLTHAAVNVSNNSIHETYCECCACEGSTHLGVMLANERQTQEDCAGRGGVWEGNCSSCCVGGSCRGRCGSNEKVVQVVGTHASVVEGGVKFGSRRGSDRGRRIA
jgi:hypothetical protein